MLPEDKRKQLDGIVQQMVQNREPDGNIKFVVDDFKTKHSIVEQPPAPAPKKGNILDRFAQGAQDLAVGAAKGFSNTIKGSANVIQKGLTGPVKSVLRPIVPAIDLLKPAAKLVNKLPEQTTKNTTEKVGYGIEQAAEFLIPSGIAGKAAKESKVVQNLVKGKSDDVLKAITPNADELNPTEFEKLLKMKKIAPKTLTKPAQYIPSEAEKASATKYKELLKDKDPVRNSVSVINEIAKKDDEVGKFLKTRNAIFSDGELRNSIVKRLDDVSDITIDPARLSTAKTELANNFIRALKKIGKNDIETLWRARKAYDRQIEKAFTGSPTLQNTVKKEFRNAVQDFISEKTGDVTYKGYMKDMSELFDIWDVLNTKATKEKNYSKLRLWIKKNPTKAKLIGATAAGGIGLKVFGN